MSKFEDLKVWQLAHELTLDIYKLIDCYPKEERYRLSDQLCRAASSIPMNICEGSGRRTKKDFCHFLYIARGSLQELHYQLILSKDLGLLDQVYYDLLIAKCNMVGKLLNSLIKTLEV